MRGICWMAAEAGNENECSMNEVCNIDHVMRTE
jgi:hypothetical protein